MSGVMQWAHARDLVDFSELCGTTVEMYRVGILPQDESLAFPVSVSGKSIGNYKVVKLLYPNSSAHDDIVFITLHQQ